MKKLTKAQATARDELVAALRIKEKPIDDALIAINNAIDAVNTLIEEALKPAIEAYNGALTDCETFRDEVIAEMDDYVSARSEKWSESDAAQTYESWKGEWESFDTSPLDEIEPLEAIESIDTPHADEFEALASEVEG